MALCSGVGAYSDSTSSTDAPASRSTLITSTFPRRMACLSGVRENALFASRDAPASRSALTNSSFPMDMASSSGLAIPASGDASRSASTFPARVATFGEASHT
eukprot:scaffold37624_cov62-Phaeocystis_antarctica.AAC.5